MRDEPETTQAKEVPSETLPLDKTLYSKCTNNVDAEIKNGLKNKKQDKHEGTTELPLGTLRSPQKR